MDDEPVIKRLSDNDIGVCHNCGLVFSEHLIWHRGEPDRTWLVEHSRAWFDVAVTGVYCP